MESRTRKLVEFALKDDSSLSEASRRAILAVCDNPEAFTATGSRPGEPDQLLDCRQVADYVGMSERSVWRYISLGILPSVKPGNFRRVRLSDLLAWVESESHNADGQDSTSPVIQLVATG